MDADAINQTKDQEQPRERPVARPLSNGAARMLTDMKNAIMPA